MTTTGTRGAKRSYSIAGAMQPFRGERTAFAFQLDLFYRLGVRMVLAGQAAETLIHYRPERRRELETILMVPHALWLNQAENDILIRTASLDAVKFFAFSLPSVSGLFEDLASLLCSNEAFYERLDSLGWSERYRAVGNTFQVHAPLITIEAARWRFNYDRTGGVLNTALESQAVPYGGADWQRNATFIREVVAALRQMVKP